MRKLGYPVSFENVCFVLLLYNSKMELRRKPFIFTSSDKILTD